MTIYSSRIKAVDAWCSGTTYPGRTRDGAVTFAGDTLRYFNAPVARRDHGTGWIRVRHTAYGAHQFEDYVASHVPGLSYWVQYLNNPGLTATQLSERFCRAYSGCRVEWRPSFRPDATYNNPMVTLQRSAIWTHDLDLPISVATVQAYWQKEAEHMLHRMRWKTSRMRWHYACNMFQQLMQGQLAAVASREGVPTPLDWFPVPEYNALLVRFDDKNTVSKTSWHLWFKNQYDR